MQLKNFQVLGKCYKTVMLMICIKYWPCTGIALPSGIPPHSLVAELLFWAVDLKICWSWTHADICLRMLEYLHACEVVNIQSSALFKLWLIWRKRDGLTSSHCNNRVLVWFFHIMCTLQTYTRWRSDFFFPQPLLSITHTEYLLGHL